MEPVKLFVLANAVPRSGEHYTMEIVERLVSSWEQLQALSNEVARNSVHRNPAGRSDEEINECYERVYSQPGIWPVEFIPPLRQQLVDVLVKRLLLPSQACQPEQDTGSSKPCIPENSLEDCPLSDALSKDDYLTAEDVKDNK